MLKPPHRVIAALALGVSFLTNDACSVAHGEVVVFDAEKIADCIYKCEGGSKTKHPYGIMRRYKTTTPRQACINTINHAWHDWHGGYNTNFINFLADRYCPKSSDPQGNANWRRNMNKMLFSAVLKENETLQMK